MSARVGRHGARRRSVMSERVDIITGMMLKKWSTTRSGQQQEVVNNKKWSTTRSSQQQEVVNNKK